MELTLQPVKPAVVAGSAVTAAMGSYREAISEYRGVSKPVRGLGDEAVLTVVSPDPQVSSASAGRAVVLRVGNLVANVHYLTPAGGARSGTDAPGKRFETGVLRAAADVAHGLGAPARPAVSAPADPAPATMPKDACALVPETLRDTLVDGEAGTSPHAGACTWEHDGRKLEFTIDTGSANQPGGAVGHATDAYLKSHYEARAEPPVSDRDPHYFHALKGLGNQGFCAYAPHEHTAAHGSRGRATVAVRVGSSLVSVEYSSVADENDDNDHEPLTMAGAVNGAYAAARSVVRAVRH